MKHLICAFLILVLTLTGCSTQHTLTEEELDGIFPVYEELTEDPFISLEHGPVTYEIPRSIHDRGIDFMDVAVRLRAEAVLEETEMEAMKKREGNRYTWIASDSALMLLSTDYLSMFVIAVEENTEGTTLEDLTAEDVYAARCASKSSIPFKEFTIYDSYRGENDLTLHLTREGESCHVRTIISPEYVCRITYYRDLCDPYVPQLLHTLETARFK